VITQIIRVDTEKIDPEKIRIVAGILAGGGVVVYPTDTFYGLGANCFSPFAVQRAYRLKKRDRSKPLSVVISDTKMLRAIAVDIPPVFAALRTEFWPGPLTLVLRASPQVPAALLGSEKTIGVRMPAHAWLRRLIRTAGFPITATSANLSGEREVTSAEQAIPIFRGKVDAIVDGGQTPGRLASTVLDLTTKNPTLIREGAVCFSRIEKFLISLMPTSSP